jgi:hypothetical protein
MTQLAVALALGLSGCALPAVPLVTTAGSYATPYIVERVHALGDDAQDDQAAEIALLRTQVLHLERRLEAVEGPRQLVQPSLTVEDLRRINTTVRDERKNAKGVRAAMTTCVTLPPPRPGA